MFEEGYNSEGETKTKKKSRGMSYKGYMCQKTCTCYSVLPAVTVAPVATMFNPPVWMVVPAYLGINRKESR
jgi:hypothetical protein